MTKPSQSPIMHGGAERLPIRWVNAPIPPTVISRYRVAPGKSVSLHVHTGKAENWVIIAGSGVVRIGEESIPVVEGDIVLTPPTVPHGLTNTGDIPLIFLNIVHPTGDEPITSVELDS
ncbi:cupin domain-containing protein [Devosia rhizoryzae]|uniref:Cupin domain-containing protein n=1 Tax=Devosia rhizoryzae TaxID=2774137 RepID=A0ABX7C714_9HYPH|nr:cupin domain-containing protein [Devosia rhizoryzae]QQR38425.1 cupin domain-containing protein [Devosia rhizoryzae]